MNSKGQEFEWQELKDIWINSPHTKKISFQVSNLLDELKHKTSQFEKDAINSDMASLKANWMQTKSKVSQFEKDAIKNDLTTIKAFLKKFLSLFKRDY